MPRAGQYLRALPEEEARVMLCGIWKRNGVLTTDEGAFVNAAVRLTQDSIELLNGATDRLTSLFEYPLEETLDSEAAKPVS